MRYTMVPMEKLSAAHNAIAISRGVVSMSVPLDPDYSRPLKSPSWPCWSGSPDLDIGPKRTAFRSKAAPRQPPAAKCPDQPLSLGGQAGLILPEVSSSGMGRAHPGVTVSDQAVGGHGAIAPDCGPAFSAPPGGPS